MDVLNYAAHALIGGACGYTIVVLTDYIWTRWR